MRVLGVRSWLRSASERFRAKSDGRNLKITLTWQGWNASDLSECGLGLCRSVFTQPRPNSDIRRRVSGFMECGASGSALLRLDVCCSNYLTPFLNFISDEFVKFRGRALHHSATQIAYASYDFRIGETGVDFAI